MMSSSKLSPKAVRSSGYTLIEIMTVLMIIAVLVGSAVYLLVGNVDVARMNRVDSDFQMITTQLRAYEMMNLSLPSTSQGLEALVKRPGGEPAPRRWIQLFERVPLDPWNKPYQYSNPGKLNPRGFDLVSGGPDAQLGTEDDINNKPASAN